MHDFNNLLNWKLRKGSHEFPGPDGGTCINEAAIVAAGFPYQSVQSVVDLPKCFSRVIGIYALQLNDLMDTRARQKLLMPFVTRLGGTADCIQVEQKRAELILLRTVREILAPALRLIGDPRWRRCSNVGSLNALARLDEMRMQLVIDPVAPHLALALEKLASASSIRSKPYRLGNFVSAAQQCANVAHTVALVRRKPTAIFTIATTILNEAIRLGRHSDNVDIAMIAERMQAARKSCNTVPARWLSTEDERTVQTECAEAAE